MRFFSIKWSQSFAFTLNPCSRTWKQILHKRTAQTIPGWNSFMKRNVVKMLIIIICVPHKRISLLHKHISPLQVSRLWSGFVKGFFFFPLLKANSLYNLTSHSLAKPILLLMFLMWLVNGDLGEIFHHLPEAGLQFCAGFDGPCRGSSLWMKTPFFPLSCKFTSIF